MYRCHVPQVRGPIVVHHSLGLAATPATGPDGWFATGDVCTVDDLGHVQITDRSKDVIKSGGHADLTCGALSKVID